PVGRGGAARLRRRDRPRAARGARGGDGGAAERRRTLMAATDLVGLGRRHQWLALGFDESYFDADPIVVAGGDGPYFFDTQGRRWLDALCGQSAAVIGHNHPRVVEAIREQAGRMASNVAGTLPS